MIFKELVGGMIKCTATAFLILGVTASIANGAEVRGLENSDRGAATVNSDAPNVDKDSVQLIGVAELSGSAKDYSGQTHEFEKGVPANMFGGISALAYDPEKRVYLALPDRGPKDGAYDYHCRFHEFQIDIRPEADSTVQTKILKTHLFDADGSSFPGLSTAWKKTAKQQTRLDPEGIRIGLGSDVFVSDEYGPSILCFDRKGKFKSSVPVPKRYLVKHPGPSKAVENSKNSSGRQSNRGMEGLAISSNKQKLFGIMQSPLLQDSDTEKGKPTGLNCRLLKVDLNKPAETAEYLYRLDSVSNKLNEILSVDDHRFLVIERDGKPAAAAQCKTIQLISVKDATEIQSHDRLPATAIPKGVSPVDKRVFIDLLDPRFGLAGDEMPEKIESLCFGPSLDDGRRTLIVVSDNDFVPDQPTRIWVFGFHESAFDYSKPNKRVPAKTVNGVQQR